MRQLRYVDYKCTTCDAVRTEFVYYDTELETPCDDNGAFYCQEPMSEERCLAEGEPHGTVCDDPLEPCEMSGIGYMKTISKHNSDFDERERARLEKRADAHWKRQGKDEAIDRERAFLKKQGAVGGVR